MSQPDFYLVTLVNIHQTGNDCWGHEASSHERKRVENQELLVHENTVNCWWFQSVCPLECLYFISNLNVRAIGFHTRAEHVKEDWKDDGSDVTQIQNRNKAYSATFSILDCCFDSGFNIKKGYSPITYVTCNAIVKCQAASLLIQHNMRDQDTNWNWKIHRKQSSPSLETLVFQVICRNQ